MKYIIAYDDTYNLTYFCGLIRGTKSGMWLASASRQLRYAQVFNTYNDAEKEVKYCDPDLSEHDILAIPEKDLFIARLKE